MDERIFMYCETSAGIGPLLGLLMPEVLTLFKLPVTDRVRRHLRKISEMRQPCHAKLGSVLCLAIFIAAGVEPKADYMVQLLCVLPFAACRKAYVFICGVSLLHSDGIHLPIRSMSGEVMLLTE